MMSAHPFRSRSVPVLVLFPFPFLIRSPIIILYGGFNHETF